MVIPLSTSAVRHHDCPKCGAVKGVVCVTPSGRPKAGLAAHDARMNLCTSDEVAASRIPPSAILTGQQLLDKLRRELR